MPHCKAAVVGSKNAPRPRIKSEVTYQPHEAPILLRNGEIFTPKSQLPIEPTTWMRVPSQSFPQGVTPSRHTRSSSICSAEYQFPTEKTFTYPVNFSPRMEPSLSNVQFNRPLIQTTPESFTRSFNLSADATPFCHMSNIMTAECQFSSAEAFSRPENLSLHATSLWKNTEFRQLPIQNTPVNLSRSTNREADTTSFCHESNITTAECQVPAAEAYAYPTNFFPRTRSPCGNLELRRPLNQATHLTRLTNDLAVTTTSNHSCNVQKVSEIYAASEHLSRGALSSSLQSRHIENCKLSVKKSPIFLVKPTFGDSSSDGFQRTITNDENTENIIPRETSVELPDSEIVSPFFLSNDPSPYLRLPIKKTPAIYASSKLGSSSYYAISPSMMNTTSQKLTKVAVSSSQNNKIKKVKYPQKHVASIRTDGLKSTYDLGTREAGSHVVVHDRGINVDGFNYHFKNAEKTRATCNKWRDKCYASIFMKNGEWVMERDHVCIPETHERIQTKVFRGLYKGCCEKPGSSKPFEVFKALCRSETKLAPYVGFDAAMKKVANRARCSDMIINADGIAQNFNSLEEFGKFLQENPEYLNYKENRELSVSTGPDPKLTQTEVEVECTKQTENVTEQPDSPDKLGNELPPKAAIKIKLVTLPSGESHVIFYDELLLKQFTYHELFIDGTFKSRPKVKGISQLLTILGRKFGRVVPFIWVLMSNRTTIAYKAVWKAIRELHPEWDPKVVMTDFEKALQNSLKQFFDGIKVFGCFFHFAQAIYRNAKKIGVAVQYNFKNNKDEHKLLHKFINLALLKPQTIEDEYIRLKAEVKKQVNANRYGKWYQFFNYFELQWMTSVKPEGFSVFDCVDRTNNYAESYHRTLNAILGGRRPPKTFINELVKLVYESSLKLERAKNGVKEGTSKGRALFNLMDDFIRQGWAGLKSKNSAMTPSRFIDEVSALHPNTGLYQLIDLLDDQEDSDDMCSNDSNDGEEKLEYCHDVIVGEEDEDTHRNENVLEHDDGIVATEKDDLFVSEIETAEIVVASRGGKMKKTSKKMSSKKASKRKREISPVPAQRLSKRKVKQPKRLDL